MQTAPSQVHMGPTLHLLHLLALQSSSTDQSSVGSLADTLRGGKSCSHGLTLRKQMYAKYSACWACQTKAKGHHEQCLEGLAVHHCALVQENSVIQCIGHWKLWVSRAAVHLCAFGVQEGVALNLPLENGCNCTDDEVHDHTYQDDWTGGGPLAGAEL